MLTRSLMERQADGSVVLQNLLEFSIDYRGVRRLEAARLFAETAFQRWLIDSHALFSPSKMDSPLKFERPDDEILKGPITKQTYKMNCLFCRSFAIDL
jgi:hypothetical protein